MSSESSLFSPMNLPTALSPSLNFFAKAWLTMATLCEPFRSAVVNSRPLFSVTPKVLK